MGRKDNVLSISARIDSHFVQKELWYGGPIILNGGFFVEKIQFVPFSPLPMY